MDICLHLQVLRLKLKQKAYKDVQTYIKDNATFISLAVRNNYIVSNSRLKGKITPNDFDVYEGISNLDIKSNESN